MARTILLTATILLAAAARLTAQDQWGVNLGVTPTWQTGPGANALFGADRVDVQGSEIRVGFVRGLDIEGIPLIVNYEVPRGLDSYVHRVGRTGRNETTGHALTLADPSERASLQEIEQGFGLKLIGT